jgi:hypothetical protein
MNITLQKKWKCFILIAFCCSLCEDMRVNATRLWSDSSVILFHVTMCQYDGRRKF